MFADCRMPGMSGSERTEMAAKRWPYLRIVLFSGYHTEGVGMADGLEAGRRAHY